MTEPPLEGLVVDSVDDVADGHTGLLGRARGLPRQLAKVLEKKKHGPREPKQEHRELTKNAKTRTSLIWKYTVLFFKCIVGIEM